MTATTESKRPKVAIVLEGGIVQAIVSDQPEQVDVDFTVIDYDTDGVDEAELVAVPQSDGYLSQALAYDPGFGCADIDLDATAAGLDERY